MIIPPCTTVASVHEGWAKLSSENLSSNAEINLPMWSTSGISPTPSESICSSHSSPEEGSPEDAFMQRCQQQIARIVAASSGDGLDPQLPMLTRIGQLPPGAHVRLAGAHARLASSLCTVPEPRSLAVNMANELAARSSKRDWQVAGAADLSLSAMWHKASAAKRARPDDWVPAAPEMLQPELSLALGELAGAHDCRCARLPLPPPAHAHCDIDLSLRWQTTSSSRGLASSRTATAIPTSPRSCERQVHLHGIHSAWPRDVRRAVFSTLLYILSERRTTASHVATALFLRKVSHS